MFCKCVQKLLDSLQCFTVQCHMMQHKDRFNYKYYCCHVQTVAWPECHLLKRSGILLQNAYVTLYAIITLITIENDPYSRH